MDAAGKLSCCYYCWKSNEDLGLFPSSENAETLESAPTQKNPERFSEMADPGKSPPWGITQSLKALRCHWVEPSKILPETLPNPSNMQEMIPCSIC